MPVTPPPHITEIDFELPAVGQDEDQFDTNQANFVQYQGDFGPEVNGLADWMNNTADTTETHAQNAENSAQVAATSAASAASISNFKGEWSELSGSLNKPATVYHNGAFWGLLNNLPNVSLSEPEPGNPDWMFTSGTRWLVYTSSETLNPNSQSVITATDAPADMQLPSLSVNDFVVLHNSTSSTEEVRLMNSAYTIRGPRGQVTPGDNLIIDAGETVHLVSVAPSILEVV